jgi:hemoglobin
MSTLEERAAARASLAPGAAVGVTEEMIARLVPAFYAKVRRDPELGPIFEGAVEDWDAHLAKLVDFWSSVMLMTGRFKGAPMAAHARLPRIGGAHFERWLALWTETAAELCPPAAAELFATKARMIAQSLQLGLAASRGEILPLRRA